MDTNPFTLLALFLSNRNQRLGDVAAGSLVIHTPRSWRGLAGILASAVLIGGVGILGESNTRNFLTPFFKLEPVRQILEVPFTGGKVRPKVDYNLKINRFLFMNEDQSMNRNNAYLPGQTILLQFEITGFGVRGQTAWVQEDLTIRYPDGSIGLKQENMIDFHQDLEDLTAPLEFTNTLTLPNSLKPGRYALILTVRDRLSNNQLTEQKFFEIEATEE